MDASRGKYFYLTNNVFGLVLDILNQSKQVHAKVGVWQKKADAANQLWYFHYYTGTIRSKLNHFCLIAKDNEIVMSPYDVNNTTQWRITGNRIHLDGHFDQCIQTIADEPEGGNYVRLGKYSGENNQHYFVEYIQPDYFYVRSKLNDRVMEVAENTARPKTHVVMWDRKSGSANQLWYEDGYGHIHSKLNHFVLDIDVQSENRLVINPNIPDSATQQWVLEGEFMVNHSLAGQVLDLDKTEERKNGAACISYARHGGSNQRWELEIYI